MSSQTEQEMQSLQALMQTAEEHYNADRVSEAAEQYLQALEGYNKLGLTDNADRLQCMRQLAECYTQMQRYGEAQSLWGDVCNVLQQMEPMPAEKYVVALFKYTKACEKQEKSDETDEAYDYLLGEADRLLNPTHPLVMSIRQSQSKFFRLNGRNNEAENIDDQLSVMAKRVHAKAMAQTMTESDGGDHRPSASTIKGLRNNKAMSWDKDDPWRGPKIMLPIAAVVAIVLVIIMWVVQLHKFNAFMH